MIPAHGEASSPDILSRTLKHRNDRLDQIKRYLDKFPESDSMQIAKELYKDLPKNYIFLAELSVRASMNFLGY